MKNCLRVYFLVWYIFILVHRSSQNSETCEICTTVNNATAEDCNETIYEYVYFQEAVKGIMGPVYDADGVLNDYQLALENIQEDVFGGDMKTHHSSFSHTNTSLNASYTTLVTWPNGIIPYVIDNSIENLTSTIHAAMDQFKNQTCIRFVPRKNEENFIFLYSGTGCWSYVGMIAEFAGIGQNVSLGNGCRPLGTVVHELNHVVGFNHEMNRADRDGFIDIYLENVKPKNVDNFDMLPSYPDTMLNAFDFHSIMMYGNHAFAKSPELVTMKAKLGCPNLLNPYSKKGLTPSDVERINILYNCKTK